MYNAKYQVAPPTYLLLLHTNGKRSNSLIEHLKHKLRYSKRTIGALILQLNFEHNPPASIKYLAY